MNKNYALLLLGLLLVLSQGYRNQGKDEQAAKKEIKISVLPGLQFDIPRFHVQPGQQVTLHFQNNDDMDHNLLLLKPGTRVEVVDLATNMGAKGMAKDYIPESKAILWHTKILHGGQTGTLNFKAPLEEGVYPYVCTLPGHGYIMYGAMYVNKSGKMPSLAQDKNIPPSNAANAHAHHAHQDHPFKQKPPYYYRTYMEGASPAAFAVRLSDQLAFCWDATHCKLRYIWSGDFLDFTAIWKGHKDAKAKVLGDIFYREGPQPTLQIGSSTHAEKPKFKGYKLLKDGHLEFRYSLSGQDVFETISLAPQGKEIIRAFRLPNLNQALTFQPTQVEGAGSFTYQGKPLPAGKLSLDAQAGKQFTLVYSLNP